MKDLMGAQLFAAPKVTRKAKAKLERAKLAVVAARERAAEMAQQPPAGPMRVTARHRQRLARGRSARP
jgi:hypothetical protein